LLADERLREEADLHYVSHMWDCYPYWYLWLKHLEALISAGKVKTVVTDGRNFLTINKTLG
jgi:hypothetical protein